MGPRGRPAPPGGAPILIAEVDRIRGLRGEVVVTVHADDPARMARLERVFLMDPGGALEGVRIQGVKRLGDRAVVKLEGYETPDQARTLVGRELFIPREASTPAPPGRYYAYQLEGLEVRLKDGTLVGTVREVLTQGPQSLLVVQTASGEALVPVVPSICTDLDEDSGIMTIDPPDGLLDLNAAASRRADEGH